MNNPKPRKLPDGHLWAVPDYEDYEQVVCCVVLHGVECWGCTCGAWQWCPHIKALWAHLGIADPLAAIHNSPEEPEAHEQ